MNQAREILVSKLYWAPGLDPSLQDGTVTYVNALEIGHSGGEVAKYSIPHYASFGQSFGPLALDEILRFCSGLRSRLVCQTGSTTTNQLCLTTAPDNPQAHSNGSVLVGAFLVLSENWSAEEVANVLGRDSERAFPCTWGKTLNNPNSWVMKVKHCWEGLAVAREHGWIDLKCLSDDVLLEDACSWYKALAVTYDCAWLVPSKILVSSDPISTFCDPNPQTFNALWEDEDDVSTAASTPDSYKFSPSDDKEKIVDVDVQSLQSLFVDPESLRQITPRQVMKSRSFRAFLQECGVTHVIRNNFSNERGLPRPSYEGSHWKTFDIEHIDLQFNDGTVPPKSVVSKALAVTGNTLESKTGAVLIHCKSGFGRSVLLACCLAIHEFDIPGSALFGWSRIVRPGAFNTIDQENFIVSLKGREDLLRYANRVTSVEVGEKTSCGCIVQ
jgi:hypothetical protein